MIYLVANFKSHKTDMEVEEWLTATGSFDKSDQKTMVICPSLVYLLTAKNLISRLNLPWKLGAQNVSAYPFGAYTGEVAAEMIKPYVSYVIVGHSERRRYFGETDQLVANKASLAVEAGITPIVCVDKEYAESQIAALDEEITSKCLYAYEPLEAIGSGMPEDPKTANAIGERIKEKAGEGVVVIYGGSVTHESIELYLQQPSLSGVLVGGASLDVEEWKSLWQKV